MPKTHRKRRRVVFLTVLAPMLILVAASNVAAYPIAPDGEPLYLAPGRTQSAPGVVSVPSGQVAADTSSPTGNVVPIEHVSSSGNDGSDVVAGLGVGLLAALAVLAGGRVVAGYRRRSAKAH